LAVERLGIRQAARPMTANRQIVGLGDSHIAGARGSCGEKACCQRGCLRAREMSS
jgi:hypothetical protein